MTRTTRYQGAIIQDDYILLIKHTEHASGRSYWLMPGGGIELGETEEACVQREMQEETGLRVQVLSLLFEEPDIPNSVYQRKKTYLCRIIDGDARPGYEPELEAAEEYWISEIGWFDLRDPSKWNELILRDPITYPFLQRLRAALGYEPATGNAI